MQPRTVAEKPTAVHLVANHYKEGVRLDTHMHREAQLVYAARTGKTPTEFMDTK